MVLGLTNGTNTGGLGRLAQYYNVVVSSGYGKAVSASYGSGTVYSGLFGITSDSTKSGMESEINSNISYAIKF